MSDEHLQVKDGKIYLTANAYIVERASELPREFASDIRNMELNPSFMWIAGRYVQANTVNKNGHFWSTEDLEAGQHTIQYVPLNVNHKSEPVGTFVEAKIVERENAAAGGEMVPEIQALSLLWAANYPAIAGMVKDAHQKKQLHFSMECISEKKQCLQCDQVYPYKAQAHEVCEHLAESATAPRRFVNPVFLGGALVMPPDTPGWADADVTDIAAHRMAANAEEWEEMMEVVMDGAAS